MVMLQEKHSLILAACLNLFLHRLTEVTAQTLETCMERQQIGNFQLEEVLGVTEEIDISKTKALLFEHSKTTRIAITKRRRYTAYCYEGGNGDPNTGCHRKTRLLNPSNREARRWAEDNICPTGWECRVSGDCWGSGAEKCLTDEITTPVGPKFMESAGMSDSRFAYHTCVSSWECQQTVMDSPVYMKLDSEGKSHPYILDANGQTVDLQSLISGKDYRDDEDRMYTYIGGYSMGTGREIMVTCFSGSKSKIMCTWKRDSSDTITFNVDPSTYTSLSGNRILIITGSILVPDKDASGRRSVNTYNPVTKQEAPMGAASSVESLVETVNSLYYIQLQSLFNTQSLLNELRAAKRTMSNLIAALSKKDPFLLGKVSNSDVQTDWISETDFYLYRCTKPPWWNSTCIGDYMYREGLFIKRRQSDLCGHPNEQSRRKYNIFKNKEYDFGILNNPMVKEADSNSEAWRWLLKSRYLEQGGVNREEKTSIMGGDDSFIGGQNISAPYGFGIFSFIASIISWINLVLIVILCLKR